MVVDHTITLGVCTGRHIGYLSFKHDESLPHTQMQSILRVILRPTSHDNDLFSLVSKTSKAVPMRNSEVPWTRYVIAFLRPRRSATCDSFCGSSYNHSGPLSYSCLHHLLRSTGTPSENDFLAPPEAHDAPPERHLVALDRYHYHHHTPREDTVAVDFHRWLTASKDGRV